MAAMRIYVNSESVEAPEGATLADVLKGRGLSDAVCATEVNRSLVPQRERNERRLEEDDRIEIVTLVGGG